MSTSRLDVIASLSVRSTPALAGQRTRTSKIHVCLVNQCRVSNKAMGLNKGDVIKTLAVLDRQAVFSAPPLKIMSDS